MAQHGNGVWKWISGILASNLMIMLLGWFTVIKDMPDVREFTELKKEMKSLRSEMVVLNNKLMELKIRSELGE